MREIEYCRKYLSLEGGGNREIAYYITVDEILSASNTVFENYGVRIKLDNSEEDLIRGITLSAEKIGFVLQALADGTVTPVGLRDVLYDMLELII